MKGFSRSDALCLGVLVGLALVAGTDSALATTATFQPLNTALTSVLSFMTGTFATTAATVAEEVVREQGVPVVSRRVFLDDVATEPGVETALAGLLTRARSEGSALAIGHPHPATLAVLERELPKLQHQGVRLVRVGELVR